MSAIRFLDDVPHIVRYGMHDDKTEKCWIFFWRNGVRFEISVDKEDVQGTRFCEKWKPLLRQYARDEMPLSQWAEKQWHPLCDLIISTSMPTLDQLAPKREYWTTLCDYLHTPAYRLRLIASDQRTEILTKVEEGPTDTGAYELSPVPEYQLPLPASLPLYDSKDLHVLNREKDWRQGPAKLSTSNGSVFFFLCSETETRNAVSKQVSNASLDAIRAQLRVLEAQTRDPSAIPPRNLPQVCGAVTDRSISEKPSETLPREQGQDASSSEQRIAGLLLTWIPRGKTLAQTVQTLAESDEVDVESNTQAWKAGIGTALDHLHQSGVYLGGREDWSYLNQYTVLINAHGSPWLSPQYASSAADTSTEEAEAGMEQDRQALVDLFEEWLPAEVAKKRNA